MGRKFHRVTSFVVAATMLFMIANADGFDAFAQDTQAQAAAESPQAGDTSATTDSQPEVRFVAEEIVQELPAAAEVPTEAASLQELVASMPVDQDLSRDMRCLAQAIYFEARGEPLDGQLAVGRVIVNRAESPNFPDSYCGVVTQRAQFSFVRGGHIPSVKTSSNAWKRAKAIARIAHQELWDSAAHDALFFHATYVRPRWASRKVAAATIDRHVFYR